jgi:hypothetical protein
VIAPARSSCVFACALDLKTDLQEQKLLVQRWIFTHIFITFVYARGCRLIHV